MSQCRFCRKSIKWVQVVQADELRWIAFNKKDRTRHNCEKLKTPPSKEIHNAWWNRED